MDTTEIAKLVRKAVKALGYTSRQVSVKSRLTYSSDTIDVIIKDASVDFQKLKQAVKGFSTLKNISYDQDPIYVGTGIHVEIDYSIRRILEQDIQNKIYETMFCAKDDCFTIGPYQFDICDEKIRVMLLKSACEQNVESLYGYIWNNAHDMQFVANSIARHVFQNGFTHYFN